MLQASNTYCCQILVRGHINKSVCAGNMTVTCPDNQGLQPRHSSLPFVLQAWRSDCPQAAVPVDLDVIHDLPGMFQLHYSIPKVGPCVCCATLETGDCLDIQSALHCCPDTAYLLAENESQHWHDCRGSRVPTVSRS